MTRSPSFDASPPTPWFRWHPALAVAVALYAAVFALRMIVKGPTEAVTLLYVLPIALLAVAFGLRAGAAGGAIGVLLVGIWVVADHVSLTALSWAAQAVPMLLLGVLVGSATDRLRAAEAAEFRWQAAQLRARESAEINDSIVQRLAVAKWSLESGDADRSLELLTESIEIAEELVVDLLRGNGGRRVGAERATGTG